ncbi:MAG: AbrB/MazE/SpoVT family DNA-binding domain-containing protein [Patescibacteria group bacterium]
MDATLVISSQGQITVPKNLRDLIGVKAGSKLLAQVTNGATGYKLILQPKPLSWAKALAGTGRNVWGNSDQYIKDERNKW